MPIPAVAAATIGLAAEFAPSLVKWIAGDDAGEVAKDVADIAKRVTGKDDIDAAAEAIRADPALVLEFQKEAGKHERELTQSYLDDKADARARDVALAQAGRMNWRADVLLAGAYLTCVAIVVAFALGEIDPGAAVAGAMFTLLGVMGAVIKQAADFEFGSSRGSKNKDTELANMAKGVALEAPLRGRLTNPFKD